MGSYPNFVNKLHLSKKHAFIDHRKYWFIPTKEVCISVPIDVPKKFLSWGVNFQFQYQMPQNITEITQHFRPVKQGSSRELPTRGDLYHVMENHLN
ncbi:unnamed protein product, partial [Timema podura]|nr:unnamed protein product [Timema podura]